MLIDAVADLTPAIDMTAAQTIPVLAAGDAMILAGRATKGSFHVLCDTETGTTDININGIDGSHDGTNYSLIVDFGTTYDNITTAGTKTVTTFTEAQLAALAACKSIKLNVTDNGTLSPTQSMKYLVFLALTYNTRSGR